MSRHKTITCGHCHTPTTGAWLCPRCQTTLAWALANIAHHHPDLNTIETKQARYGSMPAKSSVGKDVGKEQPLPLDGRFINADEGRATLAPANQLRWDTWNTIVAWTRTAMAEVTPYAGPTCTTCTHPSCAATRRAAWPTTNTIPAMVTYLARSLRWILHERWVVDLLDEMLDLERRLTRMVDSPPARWYAGRCAETDQHGTCNTELYARDGAAWITCSGCDIRYPVTERREVLIAAARDVLVTATEAAAALSAWTDYDGSPSKLADLIRKWCDRDRLDCRGHTRDSRGRERRLYRLGDVQELLVLHAQREQDRRLTA